jgi:hypothetical protein
LLLHLTAVFVSPFAFISSSSEAVSPVAAAIADPLRPYIDFAYLNHGYAFFAPNPGPSHLVRWRLEFDDGRTPVEQTFPDVDRHWPRLLYHRHFMLAEQLNSDFVPPQPPDTDDEGQLAGWRRRRAVYAAKWRSYENQLRTRYAADRVTLTRVEHELPSWEEVQLGRRRLDAEDSYLDLSEGTVELPGPLAEPEELSAPNITQTNGDAFVP